MGTRLSELLAAAGMGDARIRADSAAQSDPMVSGMAYDSRMARAGSLFFALDGLHTDGHRFAADAVARGAVAVVASRPLDPPVRDAAVVCLDDPRRALSTLSAAFYGNPSHSLPVVGVTGTDGKSTTVYLIHQLFGLLGRKSGMLSTVNIDTGAGLEKNPYRQSTPEASEIHALLADMKVKGCAYAVVEATSHGLSTKTSRLADVLFRVGVLTNVTHEHLEFHGTIEQYANDKANLFRALTGPGAFGAVNAEEPRRGLFEAAATVPVHRYSSAGDADLRADDIREDETGIRFTIRERGGPPVEAAVALIGRFNVDNVLAAVLVVTRLTGTSLETIVPLLPALKAPPGRQVVVRRGQPFSAIVDYAHTPGAFRTVLPAMRERTPGRLIAVFGSAGERDTAKRPIQGAIAEEYCDIVVLTDEDPRGETSEAILREIAAGMKRKPGETLLVIPSRTEAITAALARARQGDTVLFLGKGHESTIIYGDGPMPWNETEAVERALAALGYR